MASTKTTNALSILSLLPLFSSCASNYVLPNHPMLSPETIGRTWGVTGQIDTHTADKASINVANDQSNNPLTYQKVSNLDYEAGVGLLSKLDVLWNYEQDSIPMVGVEYELDKSTPRSGEKGFRAAIYAAYGLSNNSMNGNVQLDYKSNAKDFAVITGYRFNKLFLAYDAISYTTYHFESTVTSSNPSINNLKPTYDSSQIAIGVGLEISIWHLVGKAELDYRSLGSTDTDRLGEGVGKLSIGAVF